MIRKKKHERFVTDMNPENKKPADGQLQEDTDKVYGVLKDRGSSLYHRIRDA